MKVAYLINQYPAVSHSFIRREIAALESIGTEVYRIAIRGWDTELVDPRDISERGKTKYVLRQSVARLFWSMLCILAARPISTFRALKLTIIVSMRANHSFVKHCAYLMEAAQVALWLRKERIWHLHAHFGTNSATVAMLASELCQISWSLTIHGPEEFDKADEISLSRKVSSAKFAIAVSSFGRSQLFRLTEHNHWSKIHVVHCGVDSDFLSDNLSTQFDSARLVCVGRLCRQKGQLLLVEAAQRLAERRVHFELVLAGDGELREEIEALIQKWGLAERVRITGWISSDQIRDELRAARALVLPSFAEGLPVAIMEAMALGRPVISTFIAGIPELVRPGRDGWLIPAGDVDALTEAMVECLTGEPTTLASMGESAKRRVAARHDIRRESTKLWALFNATNPAAAQPLKASRPLGVIGVRR